MIISRTPYRISFFGGGTDYPVWYRRHGGEVLATAIDKYCYLSCRYLPPFFEHKFRVVYSKIEDSRTVDEIQHPAVRETLRHLRITRGVEIHHDGDLPARSGIGSSSSFTVGLLHALHALEGGLPDRHQLALESIHLEQEILKETVGSQDQVLAAYGGFNRIVFHPEGNIEVREVDISEERMADLHAHLMLFFTGVRRLSSAVASSYVNHFSERESELRRIRQFVTEGLALLRSRQGLESFGVLMHEAWKAKTNLSANIASPDLLALYEMARSAGALGGKLTGAGGGGFLLLVVPPERHPHVRSKLSGLIEVPFRFEVTGSRIIFSDREADYSLEDRHRAVRPDPVF